MIVIESMCSCLKDNTAIDTKGVKRTQFEKYYLWMGAVLSVQHTISAPSSPKIEKLTTNISKNRETNLYYVT